MTRVCSLPVAALAVLFGLLGSAACTLILNTKDIIQPCTSNADCEDGFECIENACLPIDEIDDGGEGEGED